MKSLQILTGVVIAGVVSFINVPKVSADHMANVDRYGHQLLNQANQLSSEIRGTLGTSHHTACLANDAARLQAVSAHVIQLAHCGAGRQAFASDLREIDRLVRQLDNHLDDAEDDFADHFGRGHRHCAPNTRTARRLIQSADDTLADLEDAVDDLPRVGCNVQPTNPVFPGNRYEEVIPPGYSQFSAPTYGSAPAYGNGRGNGWSYGAPVTTGRPAIQFNGRGFSITLGN